MPELDFDLTDVETTTDDKPVWKILPDGWYQIGRAHV